MRTAVLVVASLLATAMPSHAQSPTALAESARLTIEAAVDRGDLAALDAAVAQVDRALALHANDALLRHYRGYALYRAGTLAYGQQDAARARTYLERAGDALEPLAAGVTLPETHAVLSAVYGMQIATSRVAMIAGVRLGPKANTAMARALELGPRNPRVWVLRGIGAFNTPGAFGGGMHRAEAYLKTALELFASDSAAAPLPAWGRADAHTWLGQVYAKLGRRDAARAEYQAALALQPGHPWITGTLLRQLEPGK